VGEGLAPGAGVRLDLGSVGLLVHEVRQEDVVRALVDQLGYVPVGHADGEARLGHRCLYAHLADLLVGLAGEHHIETTSLEERSPEGQAIVRVHRPRDTDSAQRSSGAATHKRLVVLRLSHVREAEGVAELHQVADDGVLVHLGALAVAIGALVAPVGLLCSDGELADIALVAAALAGELTDGVLHLLQVPAPETGGCLSGRHLLPGQERRADGADHPVVRRDDDVLVQDLAEGGGDGVVVGGAALEVDGVTYVALTHQAVEVVEGDGVSQSRH
jgi:hypothetical protein